MNDIKAQFSKHLFWDIDIDDLDMEKHAQFVLERGLQYGSFEDWQIIRNYYSFNNISEMALNIRSLEPTALTFVASYINKPITEFRCYKLAQLNPEPWFSYSASNQ